MRFPQTELVEKGVRPREDLFALQKASGFINKMLVKDSLKTQQFSGGRRARDEQRKILRGQPWKRKTAIRRGMR